jgi:hypothetical protein
VVWRIPAIEQLEDRPPEPGEAPTGPVTEAITIAPGVPRTRTSGQS